MPKSFPAGTGEKMQYLLHDFNDNTIRFILKYQGLLQPEILCRATRMLVDSCEILHASFQPGSISAYWYVNQEYEDHCFFQYVKTEGDPVPTALSLSLQPVSPDSKTQLRCCLVQSGTESAVAVNISHLCVDGGDGKYLLAKLAEAYNLLSAGNGEALEIKNGSRATEQVYEGLDSREILSLLKDPRTGIKSVFPYPDDQDGMLNIVWRSIPADQMNAARKKAKVCGATANDLLLAACYHAYGAVPGVVPSESMSITSMMDLRRHCKSNESEGLSNLSGSLPTQLVSGVHDTFEDTLRDIASQTAQAKENPLAGLKGMPLLHGATRTLPMWLLLMVSGKIYGSMSIGLTNLGNIDCQILCMNGIKPCAGWFGGPLKKKPAMQVSVASFDGACSLCVVGRYTTKDAGVLQQMVDKMAEIISKYAAGELI